MKNIISSIMCALLLSACILRPTPITEKEMRLRLTNDLQNMYKDQEELKGPVTLYEAIARTLRYNLDYRTSLMEEAVEKGSLNITRLDLLPTLTANAGYHSRSEFTGATSTSLLDGSQSLEASTSQERKYDDRSIVFSWNILDFGVSYVRAKQQANQVLIADELRRKAIQNIVYDVIDAYWRVAAVQSVKKDYEEILKDTLAAIKRAEKIEAELLQPPISALQNQQSLLDLKQKLLDFDKQMMRSMYQLSSLMSLKIGTKYEVVIPEKKTLPVIPTGSIASLEEAALLNRSELHEADYRRRISRLEVRKAILQMLPGIELNKSRNYTANDFTFNPYWNELTARLTYNLVNMLSGPFRWKYAKTIRDLEDVRRLAISMNIITQVHLSIQNYEQSLQSYHLAEKQHYVKNRIVAQVEAAKKADAIDELQFILSRMRKLSAKMQSGLTYAELQVAAARIYHSIGQDRIPDGVEGYDIPTLAAAVKASMEEKLVFEGEQHNTKVKSENRSDDNFKDKIKAVLDKAFN